MEEIADAELAGRLAKALANATTGFHNIPMISAGFEVRKIALGTALLSVMRTRNHALAVVPKMPAADEDVAIQTLLGAAHGRGTGGRDGGRGGNGDGAVAGGAGGTSTGTSGTGAAYDGLGQDRARQSTNDRRHAETTGVLRGRRRGRFPAARDGAAGTGGDRQSRHRHRVPAALYRALPSTARSLVEVYPADLALNHCLNVLSALANRISAAGDDLIRKGTILPKYRESAEQRQQDRERAKPIAKLRQGDVISARLQICVVDHSLATAYDFLQIPYLIGKVASSINGDWDMTWYLRAEVTESQLGKECDIAAGVEHIARTVRQEARKGDVPWSDQQRADYGAVALFHFARDYWRWSERWPGAERPSLLRVLTSVEFPKCMVRAFDYANKPEMQPDFEPCGCVVLGKAQLKRKHGKITAAQLFAGESDDDVDGAAPSTPPAKDKRKKKKKEKAGDKAPSTKGRRHRRRPQAGRRQAHRRRRRRRPGRRRRLGPRWRQQNRPSAAEAD